MILHVNTVIGICIEKKKKDDAFASKHIGQ